MREEILTLDVRLDGFQEVRGGRGSACMILFHGTAAGPYFSGEILPGGVDTQKAFGGEEKTLSARYILRGQDKEGNPCSLFIENNGTAGADGSIRTTPLILTDSKALSWMEEAVLSGAVESGDGAGKIVIRIYREA